MLVVAKKKKKKNPRNAPASQAAPTSRSLDNVLSGPPDPFASNTPGHSITTTRQEIKVQSGPIPSPETLAGYDDVVPGSAKMLIEWTREQSKHRMYLERRTIDSDANRSWAGLAAGFILCLAAIIIGGALVYLDHDWAGVSFVGAAFGTGLTTFIYGTSSRKQERVEKAKVMAGEKERSGS